MFLTSPQDTVQTVELLLFLCLSACSLQFILELFSHFSFPIVTYLTGEPKKKKPANIYALKLQRTANRQSENVGPTLTQTVVPVVCQAKTIVASASVISWDVDALVDAAAVILRRTLVYICRDMKHRWGLAAAVTTRDNRHTTMEPW